MSDNENTTNNMIATQSTSCPSPTAEKIGTIFAYCLIFIVSLTGNTIIGIIVYKTHTMRKPINFFIVNMAISDIVLPIFKIPQLIQVLYIDFWPIDGPLGEALCKLVYFLKDVSVLVSIQSLVLIAVDRFGAVVFPLRSPLIRSKMCPFFIIASWIVAMALNSPKLFVLRLVEYPDKLVCKGCWREAFGDSSSHKNYILSFKVVSRFFPLVLIATLYIIIYLKLKSQEIPGEQLANAGQRRRQRERNVLKMAIAIVLGFAICWLPRAIWLILLMFTDTITWPDCSFRNSFYIVQFMALVSCAINPCICFIFSRNYRKELKALL